MMEVVDQMLRKYRLDESEDITPALREVMQELALSGLYRAGFFEKAAFYGGTCLRIFYGLPRFSEDLDFSLLVPNSTFSLEPYFASIIQEFAAFGFTVEISHRQKSVESAVVSAFLKKNSSVYDLNVASRKVLKIKFEVDTDPPQGFMTEERLLLQPYSFYVKCFSKSDLFAGKMHALLFRQWKNRVKGRDWFDFEWYIRQGIPLNLTHLAERARQSGDLHDAHLSASTLHEWLLHRIESLDVESAKQDVMPFIKDTRQLAIWSKDYFRELADKVAFLA